MQAGIMMMSKNSLPSVDLNVAKNTEIYIKISTDWLTRGEYAKNIDVEQWFSVRFWTSFYFYWYFGHVGAADAALLLTLLPAITAAGANKYFLFGR